MCEHTTDAHAPNACESIRLSACAEQDMPALADALGLNMRQGQLTACASYYRAVGRDPSLSELCLLDACIASLERYHLADQTLQSLDTDDSALASTLQTTVATLSNGRRSTPTLTLRRILGTPDATLPLFDTRTDERLAWMSEAHYAMLCREGNAPTQSLAIGDTGLRLCATVDTRPAPVGHAAPSCILSLLTLPDKREATFSLFRQWLDRKQTRRQTRRVLYVPRGALLATIIAITNGCQVDLRQLCPDTDRTHAEQLAEVEGYLLVSPQSETRELLQSAREEGLNVRAFGRPTNAGELSLSERNTVHLSLPFSFLHTFDRPRSVALRPRRASEVCTPKMIAHTTDHRPADGWQRTTTHPADAPVTFGAWTVLHTTFLLDGTLTHQHVTEALAQAALRLVATGADFDTLVFCSALSLHPDHSPCPAWLAALGLRTLTEAWRIPLADAIVMTDDQRQDTLTVCLIAKTLRPCPSTDHCELRLLATPRAEDDSLPLPMLEALLRTASRAMREGHAMPVSAWLDRTVAEGLSDIADGEVDATVATASDANVAQLGLLLRSDGALTQGVPVGRIPSPPSESPSPTDTPHSDRLTVTAPPHYSAVHRPSPIVLMPLCKGVDYPTALTERIAQLGARAHVLSVSPTHEDCTALADAIAACDILLWNGDPDLLITLAEHRRVLHALQARLPHHATLVLLLRAAKLTLPDSCLPTESVRLRRLPDGIAPEELQEMVKYYQ